MFRRVLTLSFGLRLLALPAGGATIDFDRDIQPILSENCYHCHGPDAGARKAKLRLDRKEGALGKTEDGVAIVAPGDPAKSDLITRIFSHDADEVMPTPKSNRRLTDAQRQLLKQWVEQGAVWGEHWAFIAPKRPAVPEVGGQKPEVRNPIDAFVVARLEKEGLKPAPEADRARLLRRVTLDLTGLPPTPEEIDAFLADAAPEAYEKAVDRLLASPRYGERMVWEWLDAARYADTNGYQGDPTRAMWYWRDWAIKALNDNMPFDQFTVEQLAGDLLPQPTHDQLIATGFHRNHMINGEGGRIPEESRVDYVMDRVETTGTVWMGLTFNCCRCHDHKFDQLKQREYYQLSAYFNSIDEVTGNDPRGATNPLLIFPTAEQKKKIDTAKAKETQAVAERDALEKKLRAEQPAWEESLATGTSATELDGLLSTKKDAKPATRPVPETIAALAVKPAASRSEVEKKELTKFYVETNPDLVAASKRVDDAKKSREGAEKATDRTMIMRERAQPRETFILVKGAYDKYADKVEHGTPAFLPPLPPEAPKNRLALARWLVSPGHPLTARVTVNRYWQLFFGRGLVKTVDDFGVQGEKPTHPELLDWLACEFVESNWDVKHLQRLIVTSATYRQQSNFAPGMAERDPENKLLARGPRYRLPSWMLRDQALAIGGLLVEKVGGPPVKVYQPANVWEDATFGKITYAQDHGDALYRRSLYIFWRRIVGPTLFFDVASRQNCAVKVGRTNTPLHALVTLNDVTYVEAARALAERMLKQGPKTDSDRLALAFRLCTARLPSAGESALLASSLERFRQQYSDNPGAAGQLIATGESKPDPALAAPELAAHAAVALLLLNLDETLSKE